MLVTPTPLIRTAIPKHSIHDSRVTCSMCIDISRDAVAIAAALYPVDVPSSMNASSFTIESRQILIPETEVLLTIPSVQTKQNVT